MRRRRKTERDMNECAGPKNLTGVWNGLYSYASGLSVSFVATLIDSGRVLSGATHEPNVLGTGPGSMLTALLSGGRNDSAITFVKTYEEAGTSYYYPVSYEGVLNGDATEIEGRWRIGDGTSGKFLMIRSEGKAVAAEKKKRAKVW
jgi:hypothetical protein